MTLAQVAAELRLAGTGNLRNDIKSGKLSAEKVGDVWIVTAEEFRRYSANRRPRGRPPKETAP